MKSKKRANQIKKSSKKRTSKNINRKRKGGEFPDYNSPTLDIQTTSFDIPISPPPLPSSITKRLPPPLPLSIPKRLPPPLPPKSFTSTEKTKESCKLCNKLNISNEYDLCKSCDKIVFNDADKLRSDQMISELSTTDALKGVFELTVVEILKKGSYHGLPGFTLLRNKTNNDPTLSPIKKAYLNALINISLNHFYRLADSVLNYNQYTQLNGPKADIKTPGDITRVLEQVSGLLNEMNKTYNTQVTANDQQIINYMKDTIISDLKKNPTIMPSIVENFKVADVSQLLSFVNGLKEKEPTFLHNLSYDSKEFIKALNQIGNVIPQSSFAQPEKKGFFTSLFRK